MIYIEGSKCLLDRCESITNYLFELCLQLYQPVLDDFHLFFFGEVGQSTSHFIGLFFFQVFTIVLGHIVLREEGFFEGIKLDSYVFFLK